MRGPATCGIIVVNTIARFLKRHCALPTRDKLKIMDVSPFLHHRVAYDTFACRREVKSNRRGLANTTFVIKIRAITEHVGTSLHLVNFQ